MVRARLSPGGREGASELYLGKSLLWGFFNHGGPAFLLVPLFGGRRPPSSLLGSCLHWAVPGPNGPATVLIKSYVVNSGRVVLVRGIADE